MILVWLAELVAAGWMLGVRDPGVYAGMLAVGLAIWAVMRTDRGSPATLCGFGGGIVIMMAGMYLAQHHLADKGVATVVALAGVVLMGGSLARPIRGR